jgi:hypothetical protein
MDSIMASDCLANIGDTDQGAIPAVYNQAGGLVNRNITLQCWWDIPEWLNRGIPGQKPAVASTTRVIVTIPNDPNAGVQPQEISIGADTITLPTRQSGGAAFTETLPINAILFQDPGAVHLALG